MAFPAITRLTAVGFSSCMALAGCSPSASSRPGGIAGISPDAGSAGAQAAARLAHLAVSRKIKHVIFVVQENRSFNNLFMGYPGATTQNYGYDNHGTKITLHEQTLATSWDIDHSAVAFFIDYDGGKMDGWNLQSHGGAAPKKFAFAYAPRNEVRPYWNLAKQYVLADNMFPSNLDGSFISHQYAIAAYANTAVNYPSSSWGCPGGSGDTIATLNANRTYGPRIKMCWTIPTIASEADAAGVSWRFYTGAIDADGGIWSAYQNIDPIFHGADWSANVISPPNQFLTDVANGNLSAITWITPTFENSDHAGTSVDYGPEWVASLVNAVGQSQFWDSTAIFVMWDDWGGWFDPVPPVYEDYDGLGFRVPLLMISPYAKKGYVTHEQYETSSVLRFMEDTFGLPPLAASDGRAEDPANDAFDFSGLPRPFKKVKGAPARDFWTAAERKSAFGKMPAGFIGGD